MKVVNKIALLTVGVGLALGVAATAHAELGFRVSSNAVDKCQSFNPGTSDTFRKRVVGVENVGPTTALSCVFELEEIYGGGPVWVDTVQMFFRNNDTVAQSVTCTILPGNTYNGLSTASSKTLVVNAGATDIMSFQGPYNVWSIGVNCSVPQFVVVNHTVVFYRNAQIP